jgi:hypothetical protein
VMPCMLPEASVSWRDTNTSYQPPQHQDAERDVVQNACGWQRRQCFPFQEGQTALQGLGSFVSVCTHRSKGDGGVARLVGSVGAGAASGNAAIKFQGGLPGAAAVCRRVVGQPRARLDEARQLDWPGCKAQRCRNASGSTKVHHVRVKISDQFVPRVAW